MNLYIDQSIFKDLCRLTLSCRRSINPNIYMTFFHSKERMTVVDYFKFRKEIVKELKINKTYIYELPTRNCIKENKKKYIL